LLASFGYGQWNIAIAALFKQTDWAALMEQGLTSLRSKQNRSQEANALDFLEVKQIGTLGQKNLPICHSW